MTHGYEWLFEYDMIDLDDYYIDIWDLDEDWEGEIEEFWNEIDEYERFDDDELEEF